MNPLTTTTMLTGDVVRAGDSGYEAARVGWNRLHSRYPEAIVFCCDTQDVVNAVRWAREEGIALRARSGRHSLEGWSSIDGGLVVDVSRMKSIVIDEAARTATVGTGLTQQETVAALGQHGFVVPTGSEGGVGLGGVILGGGFGLLTRSMGMACDNLLAAEVVVADGARSAKVVEATEHNNSDLLWACRGGGGGNFGIATSYTLRLHELSNVTFLVARWTGHDHLGALLRGWQRDAPVADDRLTSALEVDSTAVELSALMYGGARRDLEDQLRSLLAIGNPDVTVTEGPWPSVYGDVDRGPNDVFLWKFYSQFVTQPFPDEAIDLIVHYMANTPSPPSNFFCSSFGGAVRHAPPGGSAFPHRDALFYCEPGAAWNDPALNSTALGWAADFWRALRPYGDGAYVNVPNAAASDWEREYYGSHRERLREVKATYDPENVFSFEQSVPPVAG
ncbi:FAD-binding oxidoreductase [Rhodococcus sp. IEGM 1305]|uniref:FAD-binding oxidoreductase n=1 Tax=Rhodococcus sp. IEGM 1305 TaxID=3047092 RepID=UPI0024B664AD|nr:FAD-binding oxidoreductase [Rhodococcus sp. IEGM 1305]MDI9951324.1 FAD-binding oxidoreductase [Rhodococcus sp. IEGM 1305]